ncbi:MAG TPA: methyltransferase domain-containing protein [Ktedonobacteraceae bacterium]|nr:methyltransferase domain-containing protein [Ktedonobacteraceae bacterium]
MLIETEETNQFTFEPFAAHSFYTQVNRSLVRQALSTFKTRPVDQPLTIVDMACGTGAISRLIAEEMKSQKRQARIIGVDPSAEALRLAQNSMAEIGAQAEFIQGDTEDLSRLVHNADAAFFCNAIHLIPDKRSAFELMASILAPNGIFACNSAFYTGAYVEGTERFYRLWTRRAIGWLRKEHPEVHVSREEKTTAMQWINADDYIRLLKEGGFQHVDAIQEEAVMTVESYYDIGQYWLFIEGALPGVPLALGAAALGTTVYQVGEELKLKDIPRNWLQLVAHKA